MAQLNQNGPFNLETLYKDSDGIIPYLKCPWCSYTDTFDEFIQYHHPEQNSSDLTGSTQCSSCNAAGATALFVLGYNPTANLGKDEQYKQYWLDELKNCIDNQ